MQVRRQLELFFFPEPKSAQPLQGQRAERLEDKAQKSGGIDQERTMECAELARALGMKKLATRVVRACRSGDAKPGKHATDTNTAEPRITPLI